MKRILLLLIITYLVTWTTPSPIQAQINIRQTANSVVQIASIMNDDLYASGTGTIVTPTGLIYTNRHVIEDGQFFLIAILEDVQELPVYQYEAVLIYVSEILDFAVLQIQWDIDGNIIDPDGLNLPYLSPSIEPVDIGQELHIFGYPTIADGYLTVTAGQIVAIQNGEIAGQRLPVLYRTDSEISSGNSGGLAITTDGRYIGLPTWVFLKEDDESRAKLGGIVPIAAIHHELLQAGVLTSLEEPIRHSTQFVDEIPLTNPTNETWVSWKFINDSNTMICYMYISPTRNTRWGEDKLANNIIFAGGTYTFEVPSGQYDILFHDCSYNELADIRNITIDQSNSSYVFQPSASTTVMEFPTQQPNQDIGITIDCGDGRIYPNAVEIQLVEIPANQLYHITVFGLNGFNPVLSIYSLQTGETNCVEQHESIGTVALELPTTGFIKADPFRSTMNIRHQNPSGMATYAVRVGSPDGQTGEFVVMVDGAILDSTNKATDIYSISLTPSLVYGNTPISIYMMGGDRRTDPILYLIDPVTYDVFLLYDTEPVICDDAGYTGCFGEPPALVNSSLFLAGQELPFSPTDALLTIPLDEVGVGTEELLYFNFGATSYTDTQQGQYRIFFHLSNTGTNP